MVAHPSAADLKGTYAKEKDGSGTSLAVWTRLPCKWMD
jgi:hypothetical protein